MPGVPKAYDLSDRARGAGGRSGGDFACGTYLWRCRERKNLHYTAVPLCGMLVLDWTSKAIATHDYRH
jgi:hypothetical protein